MSMRRADRRDESYDNWINHPHSRQPEPISSRDATQRLVTLRSQNNELRQQVQDGEKQLQQAQHQYLEKEQEYQSTVTLYREAQTQAQSYLALYDQEAAKHSELLVKYETVQAERENYLTLYNDAQAQLKFERRSKAGIKGWETRRKRENELLKREIAEMTVLLRDSLSRKEEAIGHLEEMADRMDRIQHLVDSVEQESGNTPVGLLQKFKRIWQAIQDILAE